MAGRFLSAGFAGVDQGDLLHDLALEHDSSLDDVVRRVPKAPGFGRAAAQHRHTGANEDLLPSGLGQVRGRFDHLDREEPPGWMVTGRAQQRGGLSRSGSGAFLSVLHRAHGGRVAPDPVGQHLPLGIVLRIPAPTTGVVVVSSLVGIERMGQEATSERVARFYVPQDDPVGFARLLFVPVVAALGDGLREAPAPTAVAALALYAIAFQSA